MKKNKIIQFLLLALSVVVFLIAIGSLAFDIILNNNNGKEVFKIIFLVIFIVSFIVSIIFFMGFLSIKDLNKTLESMKNKPLLKAKEDIVNEFKKEAEGNVIDDALTIRVKELEEALKAAQDRIALLQENASKQTPVYVAPVASMNNSDVTNRLMAIEQTLDESEQARHETIVKNMTNTCDSFVQYQNSLNNEALQTIINSEISELLPNNDETNQKKREQSIKNLEVLKEIQRTIFFKDCLMRMNFLNYAQYTLNMDYIENVNVTENTLSFILFDIHYDLNFETNESLKLYLSFLKNMKLAKAKK